MGYTGSVYYNGENFFQEWKSDGSEYCMDYPTTYMRMKPCLLDLKSINNACKLLHHGVTGYGYTTHNIKAVLTIIQSLTALIDDYNDEMFDENGNLIAIIKMQNSDCSGNSQDINFYERDRVSDVASVKYHQRISITKDELNDIQIKRRYFIATIDVFSAFQYIKNGKDRYQIIDDIMNIKSIYDVYNLIEIMQSVYLEINKKYLKSYKIAMKVTKLLEDAKKKMSDGIPMYVRYANNHLYLINGNTFENSDVEVDEFFMFSELFKNNGIESCGAGLKIKDKKTLKDFIASFPLNEKRSKSLENVIINIYNEIKDDETFSLSIGGGY